MIKQKHKKLSMAVVGACALFGTSAANAVGPLRVGDWDLSFAGEVNAFYIYSTCTNDSKTLGLVGGLIACSKTNHLNSSQVRDGLLPSALVFSAKTTQEGFDIGVTIGMYPGSNAHGAVGPQGQQLGSTDINMRQQFLTFGDKEMGTFKFGRDLGIFGSDAILSDATLLSVGTALLPATPTNTTLGRIGLGYIYADWIEQITYISPSASGLQGTIGIFQPYAAGPIAGGPSATISGHQLPGFQGKLTYDYDLGGVTGRVWTSFFYQRNQATAADLGGPGSFGVTAIAADAGIKAAIAGLDGVLYYYQGRGIGTTGILLDGVDLGGHRRNSNGGYAQVGYKMGKWRPVVSYGGSWLHSTSDADAATGIVARNRSGIVGLYYSLTKSLTLVGEYAHTRSNDHAAPGHPAHVDMQNDYSVGAILFF
ncbi:MAG TPA: hypothetical protein VHE58_10730 [Burkholderiales bacterium]|nr:hypothetical protein [Burkholderiales bacterium]